MTAALKTVGNKTPCFAHPLFPPAIVNTIVRPTLEYSQRTFHMSSLIEGWFELTTGKPFTDDSVDPTASPSKKAYLTVFESCACLGPISVEVFISCKLRMYLGGQNVDHRVIHGHGRFSVLPATDEQDPSLLLEIHRFDAMDMMDPSGDQNPEGLRTSVTLCGRVVPVVDGVTDVADKFFTLEVSEYIRDYKQTFSVWSVYSAISSNAF